MYWRLAPTAFENGPSNRRTELSGNILAGDGIAFVIVPAASAPRTCGASAERATTAKKVPAQGAAPQV